MSVNLLPVIHMKLYRIILSLTQAGSLRSNFKAEELPRLEREFKLNNFCNSWEIIARWISNEIYNIQWRTFSNSSEWLFSTSNYQTKCSKGIHRRK